MDGHEARPEAEGTTVDDEEAVPNGEEEIDEHGRNATQQRMVEEGEPPVE